jgi:hypothetical protein
MPKISMVIPTYTLNSELEEIAYNATVFYRDQVDELIITEDGGMFSQKLMDMADIYTRYKTNGGFTKNVNRGWKQATGDYVMIVNSDTWLSKGKLVDLCIPGKVTSPVIRNQTIPFLAGPFWCAPKEVTKERGYLMEEMHTYSSDSEYDHRIRDIFQKVPEVEIMHYMAKTVTAAGVEGGVQQQKDREIYSQLVSDGKAK